MGRPLQDAELFDELWRKHHQSVARFVARRVPANDVADVVSETYTAAWCHINELERPGAKAWLLGTARRQCANRIRSSRRHAALADRIAAEPQSQTPTESDMNLAEAFNALGAADREVLALITWEELTPAEAAEVLGIPPARFRVRLHRARARFKDAMEETSPASRTSSRPAEELS